MTEPHTKPRPWLIAAWPGMGNVAIIAASYLVQELGMKEAGELPAGDHFDVVDVEVKDGIVAPARLPRGAFFSWRNPGPGRDLIVFIGESQPATGAYTYALELLGAVSRFDIERVVTFASLASGLHPAENPKVSGVATDAATLDELRRAEVEPVADGQIGGLNGLLLAVAAARRMSGLCLLAEIPYFAMRVPNPKASRAALSVFSILAGIDISLGPLGAQAEMVDRALIEAMRQMEGQAATEGEDSADEITPTEESPGPSPEPHEGPAKPGKLNATDLSRIERLFDEVRRDPAHAVRLKNELDRLGVFKEFEGRFLDLFRRAG